MHHEGGKSGVPSSLLGASIHPLDFNVPVPESLAADPDLGSRDLNMHDLNLLQHYILHTSKNMSLDPRKILVWERVIPEIAADNPFIMHLLLALAGLDILTTQTLERIPVTADAVKLQNLVEHHQKGLQGLQEKLTSIEETNAEALFAGSMLIVGFAFGSLQVGNLNLSTHVSQDSSREHLSAGLSPHIDGPRLEWLRLVRGVGSIAGHLWIPLKLSRLRPLLLFNNANEDWKLLGPDHVPSAVSPGCTRSEKFSAFALGASQAISSLREFWVTLKATTLGVGDGIEPSHISGPSPESDENYQLGDLFEAQNQAIVVAEEMYKRVVYVLELQHIEASPSDREIQAEMEGAALTSWPHLVSETFISSLESSDGPDMLSGLSFTILAHLYLLLTLLDHVWYHGKNVGDEITKIHALVAELGDSNLLKLMEWPMTVADLNSNPSKL